MKIFCLVISISVLSAFAASAEQSPQSLADAELPSLLTIYKDFHTHPELSAHEERSAAIVAKELKAAGCDVTERVGKYDKPGLTCFGVIGVMKNGDGPTVAIRTDLDALPVHEKTGLAYASTVTTKNDAGQEVSVMHACGHDIHITNMLGTAKMLAQLKDQWRGTLVLISQPAEETLDGAKAMLAGGLYRMIPKPDFAIALHDNADLEAGKVAYCPGFALANSTSVEITIRGLGGHGSAPQATKDPIVVAAQTILALQTIVSRENLPLDPAVVPVGSIHGGAKSNIIPDEVKLLLTVRSYKEEVRQHILASIARITKNIAAAAGIPEDRAPIVKVSDTEVTPATYNDPKLTERLAVTFEKPLGTI